MARRIGVFREGHSLPRRRRAWLAAIVAVVAAGERAASAAGSSQVLEGEQRSLPVELRLFNRLANASFASNATTANLPLPQFLIVLDATNAAPIEIRTPIPHALSTGEIVVIKGVLGNEAANGRRTVTAAGPMTFTLDGSAGSGTYAGGGSVFPEKGQPVPAGSVSLRGDPAWTPWFSRPADAPATEFFLSDGARPVGEVYTNPEPTPATSVLTQEIDGSLFRPGERLCLSIEARVAQRASERQSLILMVTAAFASARVYRGTFPGTVLSTEFQRFALCFALDPAPIPEDGVLRVEFGNEALRGGGISQPMYWARPMLNEGTAPAPWTPAVEPLARERPFR